MKKIVRFLVFLLTALSTQQLANAQTISVSVNVKPPYSLQPKDYIQQGNNVTITMVNLGSVPTSAQVFMSLEGVNNSVQIKIKPTYVAPVPLQFGPSEIKVLTLNQLKAYNGNPGFNDIIFQGYDSKLYFGNGSLPEGMYKVCAAVVTGLGPAGGGGGTFSGCGIFQLTAYDAPIILNPVNNAKVKPLQPQNLFFNWTPSGIAGKTNYTFKLVDLTNTPVNNPNDAFQNYVQPFFQQTGINTNSLVYDLSKIKLTEGHTYAVQVTAYDPAKSLSYKNQGKSPVIVFVYKNELGLGNNAGNQPNQGDAPLGPCNASTKWNGNLTNSSKDGLPNGTQLAIGNFVIKNTSFTKTIGGYDGSGEVLVNFLNTKLKVEFKGIKVNNDNRVFEGAVTGKVASNSVINDAMSKQKAGSLETVPNMDALMDYLENGTRAINKLNTGSAIDLPVHIDKNGFNIGIVGMIFEPTEAYVNTVLNTPLPQSISNSYLLLAAKGIAVHPNGYGAGEAKLSLAKDVSVNLSDKLTLDFTGGSNKTYATFDCSGFKSLNLNGAVTLNRSIALPLDNNYDVINNNAVKVKAPFELKNVTGINDLLLDNISFSHKFAIPDATDFAFECKELSIDLSNTKNGNAFNTAYPDKQNKKDWTGIYIKSISVVMPEGFKKKGGGRMLISAQNAYVDKMGFSGTIAAEGKVFSEGTVAGWGIELNMINLKVSQSKLAGGGFGGVISLPLGDKTDLGFNATISKGDANGANVALMVETKDEIDANLFFAKIKLFEGSSIEVGKQNGKYFAKANLNGQIGISISSKKENSNVGKFNLPEIEFQELTIDGKDQPNYTPNFDLKFASLQNNKGLQAKVGTFELNLNDLSFKKSGDKKSAGLSFDLGLSLFGGEKDAKNGAGATTAFTIWAKHDGTRFKYDKASLDAISIRADLGVAKLEGSLNIYDEDPVYGNGFRGSVSASLAGLGVSVDVTLQFGKTLENKGNYKYWYFDAMVDFGKVGLNIPGTAASIYGLGGGAWCNMVRSGGSDVIKPGSFNTKNGGASAAPTTSGVTMVPQSGNAGFKAAVLFGITGSREAFNGDLTFAMDLNSKTLSVNHVKLEGNAYLMQNPTDLSRRDPNKAFLYCNALIEYDKPNNVISGNFAAHVNILNIIEGGGEISFKFDMPDRNPDGTVKANQPGLKWFLKVGQWTPNTDPFEDDARLHASIGFDAKVLKVEIKLQGYFMVGNDLLSGLPPLPDKIYQVTKSMGATVKKELPASVSSTQSLAFAFGAGIKLSAGFDIKIVSASVEAAAGFDVLISDLNATCDGSEMGFNGWYAQGQAYAYIDGNIKFLGAPVAKLMAGAVFQVKLPNPTWVRGDVYFYINVVGIEGHFYRTIEKGSICANMKTELDPFENMKLIKYVTPENKTTKVSPIGTEATVSLTYGEYEVVKIFNAFTENYDFYYPRNQITVLDKNKKEINKKDYSVSSATNSKGRLSTIKFNKTLGENTEYYIYVKAEIQGEKSEELYSKFTTGDRPAKFGMKDLVESYPLPNQRFFMRQTIDGTPIRGFLHLKQDLLYLFEKGEVYVLFLDQAGKLAAYAKASGSTQQEYNVESSSKVYFDIPKELKSSTIYQIKLLGPDPEANKGDNANAFGKVVFDGFYFKTSKYNNFQEKLNTFKVVKTGYIRHQINANFMTAKAEANTKENVFFVPVMMLQGGEDLDGYEMFGYKSDYNGYDLTKGQLMFVHPVSDGAFGGDYLDKVYSKYMSMTFAREFDKKIVITPEITKDEATFLQLVLGSAKKNFGSRSAGFPFEGAPIDADGAFRMGPDLMWMQNAVHYKSVLQQSGALSSNETITGPKGPLTQDEINGGGGGGGYMNNNIGLKGSGPEQKAYYALMDYTGFIAAWDHYKWLNAMFKAGKSIDLWRTYKLTEKLGLPTKVPYGKKEFTITGTGGKGNGNQAAKVKLSYQYAPPAF